MITEFEIDGNSWYTWTETCDHCGVIIHKSGKWKSSSKPDSINDSKGFCLKCLNYAIDNGFNPYKEDWRLK